MSFFLFSLLNVSETFSFLASSPVSPSLYTNPSSARAPSVSRPICTGRGKAFFASPSFSPHHLRSSVLSRGRSRTPHVRVSSVIFFFFASCPDSSSLLALLFRSLPSCRRPPRVAYSHACVSMRCTRTYLSISACISRTVHDPPHSLVAFVSNLLVLSVALTFPSPPPAPQLLY